MPQSRQLNGVRMWHLVVVILGLLGFFGAGVELARQSSKAAEAKAAEAKAAVNDAMNAVNGVGAALEKHAARQNGTQEVTNTHLKQIKDEIGEVKVELKEIHARLHETP